MELSEILPVEMAFSAGWADEHVLPNEYVTDLHDCMELAVSDGYFKSESCSSPEMDVSIDNVTNWLEEIGEGIEIPEVQSNDLYTILSNEICGDDYSVPVNTDYSAKKTYPVVYTSSPVEDKLVFAKDASRRRKQRIVPIYETFDNNFSQGLDVNPLNVESKQESFYTDLDNDLVDIIMAAPTISPPSSQIVASVTSSDSVGVKEEPKVRRKRGLSHVEKKDRKKESNRNASYRYRQRKKMQKDSFVEYSIALNEELQAEKKKYLHTAEELLRYIKHANLIRAVKDECCQLRLE